MSDYIKREDAIKVLEGWKISGEMILGIVQSADVVEVVRCKDCKHWQDGGFSSYCICDGFTHSDDYCSYGERKDEGL